MKNFFQHFLILLCLVLILVLPYFVFAQSPTNMLEQAQTHSGYAKANSTSAAELVGKAINAFLSFLGVIFITLMLYGGFNWMTASGDEGKLNRAKDTIRRAIIGLVIVVASWSIWAAVIYFIGYSS